MSVDQLTTEPAAIYAGDTINWLIAVPDYPATGGWTLKYKAVSASGYFAIVSTASGADHLVSVAQATTDDYVAGTYTLVKYVENGSERVTLAELTLEVKPFLAGQTAAYDNRSHVKRMLDAIEATLEGTATSDQRRVKLGDKELERYPIADLLKWRSTYYNYYQQELAAAGLSSAAGSGSGKIRVRL